MKERLSDKYNWVRTGAGVGAIVIVYFLANDELEPEVAWTIAVVLAVAAAIILVPPRTWSKLLSRVSKASIGILSVELRSDLALAAQQARPEEEESLPSPPPADVDEDISSIRLRLEWKLAFVAKHLLAGECCDPDFLNIGSLRYDEFLTEIEARTAVAILTTRDADVAAATPEESERFLSDAAAFVKGFRAAVFWNQVKKELVTNNWYTGQIRGTRRRKDLLGAAPGRPLCRIAPCFATDPGSTILTDALERLATDPAPAGVTRRIVVVPDIKNTSDDQIDVSGELMTELLSVRLVKFSDLALAMGSEMDEPPAASEPGEPV